jgi:hypothetical protein
MSGRSESVQIHCQGERKKELFFFFFEKNVKTPEMIPVISAFADMTITNGEMADHSAKPSHEVSECGSFVYLDSKEIDFRGKWNKDGFEAAWVHPVNEPTRTDATFPILQVALKGNCVFLRFFVFFNFH